MTALRYSERPADGAPAGLVVLHHGRGTDERDLIGLAGELDAAARWRVVTPRGPLQLPGSPGYHWYVVPRVGYPDPATFHAAYRALSELHDALSNATPFDVTTTEQALRTLADSRGVSAAKLIHPLRLALTGRGASPPIFDVAVALGRERTLRRLQRLIAYLQDERRTQSQTLPM